VAALKKIIVRGRPGVNDALAAEVIQVDVSLSCYAGVEMVAAIKRACAQAGTIRQTIEATTVA
jgi:hypothetical protein